MRISYQLARLDCFQLYPILEPSLKNFQFQVLKTASIKTESLDDRQFYVNLCQYVNDNFNAIRTTAYIENYGRVEGAIKKKDSTWETVSFI